MIQISTQYHNKALEIAVYDITDTAGHFSGSTAVEYVYELDTLDSDLTQYEFVGPLDENGFAFALHVISWDIAFNHDNKSETDDVFKDALALIAAKLM